MRSMIALLVIGIPVCAADWPQYRGPNRDDVSPERGLLKEWPAGGPPLLWTFAEAGVGYSPPAVVGDRVYITGGRDDEEFLIALDAKTGKEVWSTRIGPTFRFKSNSWSAGPSASPTVAGDLVYALGGNGDLIAVETSSDKERWRVSFPTNLGGQVNPIGGGPKDLGWGYTGSPLIDGEKLVCAVGGPKGTLAALEKKTGKIIWRSTELKDQAAYTSPMPAEIGGVKQYVILTNPGLAGVAAKDGKVLWSYRRKQSYGTEVINTPLIKDNLIYTTVAAGNGACELLKVELDGGTWTFSVVYSNKNLLNHHGNVVLVGDHVYGCDQRVGWVCQKFANGDIVWSERKLPSGSVTYADGRLYCYTEGDGTVALIEASDKGYKEHGRFKIPRQSKLRQPQGKVWTPPVVAGGKLLLRDQELLFCFDVKAK